MADYQAAFPDWQLVNRDQLVRVSDMVAQVIWFDRLSDGACRPTCRTHVLSAPGQEGGTSVLSQFLGIKHQEITLRSHARMLPPVVEALKTEITPSIVQPLSGAKVAELLRSQFEGHQVEAYAMACLCATLGQFEKARRWIHEYHAAGISLGRPPAGYQLVEADFLKKVEEWMDSPAVCAENLARIVKEQTAILLKTK